MGQKENSCRVGSSNNWRVCWSGRCSTCASNDMMTNGGHKSCQRRTPESRRVSPATGVESGGRIGCIASLTTLGSQQEIQALKRGLQRYFQDADVVAERSYRLEKRTELELLRKRVRLAAS